MYPTRFGARVAREGVRVDVAAVEDGACADPPSEREQLRWRVALEQHEIRAVRAQPFTQIAERVEEALHDRRADARPAQEHRVEHERARDPLARARRRIEDGVVVEPQIASQPDQRNGNARRHASSLYQQATAFARGTPGA